MLEQKLADASEAARAGRSRLIIILIGTALAVALFLVGFVKLDLSVIGISSEPAATSSQPTSSEPTKAPVTKAAPAASIATEEANDEARQKFKAHLATFDSELKTEVETEAFAQWNAAARDEILAAREAAVTAFTAGDYSSAISKIENATAQARTEISSRNTAFQSAFKHAENAYGDDDYDAASVNINEALRFQPNDTGALALSNKIGRLPDVLELVQKAVTARIENNLELEADLLRQIISLAPERESIQQRLKAVMSQINEARYARFISNGMKAVAERKLGPATKNLNDAKAIFAGRDEISILSKQVATLKRELEAETFIANGINASANDDWETAAQLFSRAGKVLPNDKQASDGLQLATTIIDLKTNVDRHLASPKRLSSKNVAGSVKFTLEKAKTFEAFSPSLKTKANELSALLVSYSTPVDITVVSDGLTHVSVRSVGQVGTVARKVIQLKPGTYSFEGKRIGYKSKLIQVDIPPGTTPVTVEVVCDEPI